MPSEPRFPALQDAPRGARGAPLHRSVRVTLQRREGDAGLLPGEAVLPGGPPHDDRRQAERRGKGQAAPATGRAAGGAQQRVHCLAGEVSRAGSCAAARCCGHERAGSSRLLQHAATRVLLGFRCGFLQRGSLQSDGDLVVRMTGIQRSSLLSASACV